MAPEMRMANAAPRKPIKGTRIILDRAVVAAARANNGNWGEKHLTAVTAYPSVDPR